MSLEWNDVITIGLLIFLEGILSIDNAVVLALLAARLPKHQQKKALTYGLIGAFVFRFIAIGLAAYLMEWRWVKFVGGGYLVYVAVAHWLKGAEDPNAPTHGSSANFWKTVAVIELTDIAFAVDSILAAVAITTKFWVVLTGGVLGVILMRFAAGAFIQLLKRFPRLEQSAYFLVFLIGSKLFIDGFHWKGIDFHSSSSPAFWIFWGLMLGSIVYGLIKPSGKDKSHAEAVLKKVEKIEKIEQG